MNRPGCARTLVAIVVTGGQPRRGRPRAYSSSVDRLPTADEIPKGRGDEVDVAHQAPTALRPPGSAGVGDSGGRAVMQADHGTMPARAAVRTWR